MNTNGHEQRGSGQDARATLARASRSPPWFKQMHGLLDLLFLKQEGDAEPQAPLGALVGLVCVMARTDE